MDILAVLSVFVYKYPVRHLHIWQTLKLPLLFFPKYPIYGVMILVVAMGYIDKSDVEPFTTKLI